ncbi:ABC transporter permease, partial [Fibrobacterales bacterium]|nr:ABC transporter permease [Fibrobacterales bacterium]
SLALGWGTMSIISKYVRSSIIETLDQDFIRTAYAKGLSKWRVLFVHALKPSLIPLISIIGSQIATLIVGSVLVEEVFRLQGLGSEFIKAAMYRDTPLLAYITLILSGTVVFFNVFADSLYRWVDPRIGKDL